MRVTNPKRLIFISLSTIILTLMGAAGVWIYLRYHPVTTSGGPGTKIVPISSFSHNTFDVYAMEGDLSTASKPLFDILPDNWKQMDRKIVIQKSKRILSVYVGPRKVKSYFCALGSIQIGSKERRNDGKTPEGIYYVCLQNPRSNYELSLLLSYPGEKDARAGHREGIIDQETLNNILAAIKNKETPPQDTPLGSYICIHGGGIGQIADDMSQAKIFDWTLGCIALRSEDIKEVYEFGKPGTTVEIKP
jgi:murein L,D-transpeptidase YafK